MICRKLALPCALFLVCLMALPAFGEPAREASQALHTAITRVLNNIKNPDWVNPATRGPLRRQVEDEVYHIFDFNAFSERTVGQRWNTFTPDEKREFSEAFAQLLFNTYLNKIEGYNGEVVDYVGESVQNDPPRVEVKTLITMKDGKKTPVNYRMMPVNGLWRVYDVVIENMSLVRNYRTQFSDILRSATPAQLIAQVREKAVEAANKPAK